MFIRYMYVISLYFQVSILLLVTVAQRFLYIVTQRTLFLQRIKTHLFKISSSVLKFSSIVLPNKTLILRMVEASCQFPIDIRQLVRFFFLTNPALILPGFRVLSQSMARSTQTSCVPCKILRLSSPFTGAFFSVHTG